MKTTRFGNEDVHVETRTWRTTESLPYRRSTLLQPGDLWDTAPLSDQYSEHYVDEDGVPIPVGAAIASELVASGARWACFTEQWPNLVLFSHDRICLARDGEVGELVDELIRANNGVVGGFPDVVARGGDGRVILREAKRPGSGDRLRPNQHAFAASAQAHLGDQLDLAVVEWGGVADA